MPAVQETRIRSLADMARALGRSEALFRLLEIAAEEARLSLDAASVSVSRLEPGTHDRPHDRQRRRPRARPRSGGRTTRSTRWTEFAQPRTLARRAASPGGRRSTTRRATRASGSCSRELGKHCAIGVADHRGRPAVGRVLRHPDGAASRTSAADDIVLPGGADGDPRRRDLAVAARGVARAAGLPRPADRAAEPARPRRARRRRPSTSRPACRAHGHGRRRSTSTGSSRSTTPSATWPATS